MEKCSICKKSYYSYAYTIPPVCPECKAKEEKKPA